jgi:hypothetical protein
MYQGDCKSLWEPNKTVKGCAFAGGAAEGEGNGLALDLPKRSVKWTQSVVGILTTKGTVTSMRRVPLGADADKQKQQACFTTDCFDR